jgi:amylosucrase
MSQESISDQIFEMRLERSSADLWPMLEKLYGGREDFDSFCDALRKSLREGWQQRPEDLKALDLKRDLEPDWFLRPDMVGYSCYTDRFCGTIASVEEKIPYLQSFGVNYLHLMPCLKPRLGPNDGGYSVQDYRQINPDLGTMDDLEALANKLRGSGISLCVDLVLNHTAKEHEWAQKALAGDAFYQDFYYFFDDHKQPRAYECSLVEIFPNDAPGSFTYLPEIDKWVWTTFHEHQWDLNWSNPWVFLEIVDVMIFLANKGVDVLRLDAVAFMWKRMGTRCQSEPEVHMILRALRACSRIATAAVIHLEEAITGPAEMLTYFGRGEHDGREGNLAYHNSLMVHYWAALATRDTRLMSIVISRYFPEVLTNATYATYLRCHDDIGWAVTDEDAGSLGFSGPMHRGYLSDFYTGNSRGSFAKGAYFQVNEETGDSRISGSLASLTGVERGQEENDPRAVELAAHRILMGNALIASFGGLPLIYMGDEIAMLNDRSYLDNPAQQADSRWLHRPRMDWDRVEEAADTDTVAGQVFAGTRHIMRRRAATGQLHGAVPTTVLFPDAPEVFAFSRRAPTGPVVCLFNFSERTVRVDENWLQQSGVQQMYDLLSDAPVSLDAGRLNLLPYGRVWLI